MPRASPAFIVPAMARSSIFVLIPFRTDNGHRARLWEWVRARWADIDVPVIVGTDDGVGPFNVAQALNRAAAEALEMGALGFVVLGADAIPDADAIADAEELLNRWPWAPLFSETAELSAVATEHVLAGGLEHAIERDITDLFGYCTAALAVRADVWADIGGYDERFAGWGCEDTAHRFALQTLHPIPPEAGRTGRVYVLWHPKAPRDRFDANRALLDEYIAAYELDGPDGLRRYLDELKA